MAELPHNSYLAIPASGSGPGLLVLHAWWGLNDFIRDFCQRLAGEGFVVLAPDLYNGKTAATIDEAKRLRSKMKQEQASATILDALEQLSRLPDVTSQNFGLIGFSLGAYFALWLSVERPELIKAVTVFYGTKGGDFAPTQAAYQGHFAESDPYTATSGVKKLEKMLRAAGRPVSFYTYAGSGHWFFESDREDAFHAEAAALAWDRTVSFLRAELG